MTEGDRRNFLARLGATSLGLSAASSSVLAERGPRGRRTAFGGVAVERRVDGDAEDDGR